MKLLIAVAAVLALSLAAAFPAAAEVAQSVQLRGVDAGDGWANLPENQLHRDIREAADLGADTIRVVLRWPSLAPIARGAYDAAVVGQIDRLLETARLKRLTVSAVLVETPCWATSAPNVAGLCLPTSAAHPPRDTADFGRYVSYVMGRWGRRLGAIEIWNEPNLALAWQGSPRAYVDLVRAAQLGVNRSARPRLPVIAGAVSGADTGYLQRLYDAGMARWSDGVSIHPYDLRLDAGFGNPTVPRPGDISSFASGVPAVHRLMLANGDRDPLWLTEFGFADCPTLPYCVTPRKQGEYLASALRFAAKRRYVAAALIYRLRDYFGGGPFFDQRLGLLNFDWSAKPGAGLVREAFADLRMADLARSRSRAK